jgi:hypothetical protein
VYRFPFFTEKNDSLENLVKFSQNYLGNKLGHTFTPGRLILTAHSGGGAAVVGILMLKKYDVHEIHLFDATYGGAEQVTKWLSERKTKDSGVDESKMPAEGGALRIIYRACVKDDWKWKERKIKKDGKVQWEWYCDKSETETQARKIEIALNKLFAAGSYFRRWYRVEQTGIHHNDIPRTFGFQLLADASAPLVPAPVKAAAKAKCGPECPGEKPAPRQQSLSLNYDEPDYFAESETDYMNY